jgi:serine/threonine protein kinase
MTDKGIIYSYLDSLDEVVQYNEVAKRSGQKKVFIIELKSGKKLALKIVPADTINLLPENIREVLLERIKREVEFLNSSTSNNLPKIDSTIISPEFVEIEGLPVGFVYCEEILQPIDEIDFTKPDELLKLITSIISVLIHLHEIHKAIHRDIKPDNIMVRQSDGSFCLIDFGVAKFEMYNTITEPGFIPGTRSYMSPEQFNGKGRVDHRSDQFSLALSIFYLYYKKHPYDDLIDQFDDYQSFINNHRIRFMDSDSSIFQVLNKMLEIQPYKRYPDLNNILKELI